LQAAAHGDALREGGNQAQLGLNRAVQPTGLGAVFRQFRLQQIDAGAELVQVGIIDGRLPIHHRLAYGRRKCDCHALHLDAAPDRSDGGGPPGDFRLQILELVGQGNVLCRRVRGIELNDGLAGNDMVTVFYGEAAHFAGIQGLNDLAAPHRLDAGGGDGINVDLAEPGRRDGDDQHQADRQHQSRLDGRRRRRQNLQGRRQEFPVVAQQPVRLKLFARGDPWAQHTANPTRARQIEQQHEVSVTAGPRQCHGAPAQNGHRRSMTFLADRSQS
jgi:hypothetical protein